MTLEEYKKSIVNELWTYGSDAIKYNISDRIVEVQCSRRLLETKRSFSRNTPRRYLSMDRTCSGRHHSP